MIKRYVKIGFFSALALVGLGFFAVNADAATRTTYYYTYECVSDACKAAERAAAEARDAAADAASAKSEYQAEVGRKNGEIAAIQADINQNQAEIDDLTVKIDNNIKKLEQLRESIKKTVVKLYLDQEVSGLEILASSGSVVDFTTKQASQEIIQGKIKSIVEETKQFKAELETQQQLAQQKKQDNESRHAEADQMRSDLASLAEQWAGREAEFTSTANAKEAERVELMTRQQHEIQEILGGPSSNQRCGGGYPYCNYALDGGVDPWGMYYRECVSYTAWRVYNAYGNMPYWGGHGNANQWVNNAINAGIPTGSTPKVGSVGVSFGGYYGHVVWVEAVNGNTVFYSDYNRAGPGMYGENSAGAGAFTYIYFGDR
jgi:surface antigen